MSALVLDSRLATTFTAGPPTGLDAREVLELVAAEVSAVLGFCSDTEEDIRSWLEPPVEAKSAALLIREKDTGALAQWWSGFQEPGGSKFDIWVRTYPRIAEPVGDDLTRAAWDTLLDWVRGEADPDQDELKVVTGCTSGDTVASRRIRDAGFVHERTFWEMRGPVLGATEPPAVDGLILTTTQDVATVHRLLTEAFMGHWGYEPTPFEGWLAMEKSAAGYHPGLWVLAQMEGTPVAVMILSRRSAADGELYVQELATLDRHRKRGIASALLRHAFDPVRVVGRAPANVVVARVRRGDGGGQGVHMGVGGDGP